MPLRRTENLDHRWPMARKGGNDRARSTTATAAGTSRIQAAHGGLERTFLANLQSSSVSRITRGSSPL